MEFLSAILNYKILNVKKFITNYTNFNEEVAFSTEFINLYSFFFINRSFNRLQVMGFFFLTNQMARLVPDRLSVSIFTPVDI